MYHFQTSIAFKSYELLMFNSNSVLNLKIKAPSPKKKKLQCINTTTIMRQFQCWQTIHWWRKFTFIYIKQSEPIYNIHNSVDLRALTKKRTVNTLSSRCEWAQRNSLRCLWVYDAVLPTKKCVWAETDSW